MTSNHRPAPGRPAALALSFLLASLALLALTVAFGAVRSSAQMAAQQTSRTFPQTGHTVKGRFLIYWDTHGGLAQQGYPISEEMQETSETDGKTYTVQYFERAVFELHPENKAPNDVLLSLLGAFLYKQKYPSGAPGQAANTSPGAVRFPQTEHTVGGLFLAYWQQHGGLAQQGYPLSEEFTEVSDLNGKSYTVQYFERAVFEYHPENAAPNNVLLSQLGTFRYNKLYKVDHLDTFEEVWTTVRDDYVYTDFRGLNWQQVHQEYGAKIRASTTETQAYSVIADMIEKLGDRHSSFSNPAQAREDDAQQRGELQLSGIGVLTQQVKEGIRIVAVIPGAPADKAGLRPYDIILAANGTPLASPDDAARLIRGQAGTTVTLTIQSPGKPPRDVQITREVVKFTYHATTRRLPGTNIVYLDLPTFYQFNISQEVSQVLTKEASAGPIDGLIINVRQNGGGFLEELDNVMELLIDGGKVGYEATRFNRQLDTVTPGHTLPAYRGKPIVVLVSGLCESACERFTVAMHDLHRGTILGTTTAGNTETVYPYDLPDGSRLDLAEATFQRMDGSSIEDIGFTPDVTLDVPWYQYTVETDPQVLAAVNVIKGK